MKVIEKDLMVSGMKCGTFLAYQDVEPELASPQPRDRVLPAPYFYEKRLFFFMIRRHEPGTKFWPNGGYEVRDEGGALRSFDLDQIILHPAVIKHKKTLDKMMRRAEKEQKKRERESKRAARAAAPPKNTTGKRGRPALDPAIKQAREAEKAARAARSGGKRGRPKSTLLSTPRVEKPTGGKRGRPALTPEAIAQKASVRAVTRARSGGKRGRPKSTKR